MTTVRTITDKGAVIAWSPIKELADFLACGTKEGGGGGFEDYGGDLSIYSSDLHSTSTSECKHICRVKTGARFCSLAWTPYTPKSGDDAASSSGYGMLAGGMADGTIIVWDVSKLINGEGEQAMLTVIERQAAPVRALQFNPHPQSCHLLATGSSDGDIQIIDLSQPSTPGLATPLTGGARLEHEISAVAWNTSVTHILATATLGGVVIVWDLKENRPWCHLKDPQRAPIADVCWHPEDGLYLATACDDDARPVLRVWDLRSSTNVPLAELSGHSKGVVSLDWCTADPSLLLSCGKDGHTFLWDITQGRAVADIGMASGGAAGSPAAPAHTSAPGFSAPNAAGVFGAPPGSDAGAVFGATLGGLGGGIGATAGRRYLVRWSKKCPSYFAACSFDRRVTVHTAGAWGPEQQPRIPGPYGAQPEPNVQRAPRWLKKPAGATFGFGGKLISFGAPSAALQTSLRAQAYPYSKVVQLCKVGTDSDFQAQAANFEAIWLRLMNGEFDVHALCSYLASQPGDGASSLWHLLSAVSAPDARAALLTYLGYDAANIKAELGAYAVLHAGQTAVAGEAGMPAQLQQQELHGQLQADAGQGQADQQQHHGFGGGYSEFGVYGGGGGGFEPQADANAIFGGGAPPASVASAEDFFSTGGAAAAADVFATGGAAAVAEGGHEGDHAAQDVSDVFGAPPAEAHAEAEVSLISPAQGHSPSVEQAQADPGSERHEPAPTAHLKQGERFVVVKGAPEDDEVLRRALVVGDFSSAVSVCLAQGRLDDALLLASVGGPDLWEVTKEEYFKRKVEALKVAATHARPVMATVVPHVLKGSLAELVSSSDLSAWRETLALAVTYAKPGPEEFSALAAALGQRLVSERGDRDSAIVCFMASPEPTRAVDLLIHRMEEQGKSMGKHAALLQLAQLSMVFRRIASQSGHSAQDQTQAEAPFLADLAQLLADESALPSAALFAAQIGPGSSVGPDGISIGDVVRDRLLRGFDRNEYLAPSSTTVHQQPFPYMSRPIGPCQGFIQIQAYKQPVGMSSMASMAHQGGMQHGTPPPAMRTGPMAAPQPAASAADIFGSGPGGFGGAGAHDQSFASHSSTAALSHAMTGYDHPQPTQQQHNMFNAPAPGQGGGFGMPAPMQQAPQGFAQQHAMQAPQQALPSGPASGPMGFGHQQQQHQPQVQQPMAMLPPSQPMPAPMSQQRGMPAMAAPSQGMGGWQPGPAKPVAHAPMAPAGPPMGMTMQQSQGQPSQGMAPSSLQQPVGPSSAPANASTVPPDFYGGLEAVRGLIPMLQSLSQLNAAELKQLQEAGQALDILAAKASAGALKADVIAKVMELSSCLAQQDFKRGPKLLSELAGAEWAQTKEWLRGIRGLVTLCATKSGQR